MAKPRNNPNAPVQGQSDSRGKANKPFNRITFFDGYLDVSDRQWVADNWDTAPTEIFEFIVWADQYGGISCKFDDRSGKWLAILFGGDTPDTGQGSALTARASTPALALFVLAYKARHKFTNDWFNASGAADNSDFS